MSEAPQQMIQFAYAMAIQDAVAFLRRAETISVTFYGAVASAEAARVQAPAGPKDGPVAAPPPSALNDIAAATDTLLAAATANLTRLCDAAAKYAPPSAATTPSGDTP